MLNITSGQNTHLNQLRTLGPELHRVNGTLIHDMPMDERLLAQGDRILSIHEDDGLLSPLKPEAVQAYLPTARMARDLKTFLRISTAINSMRSLETLQRKLLELIFEIIPADRGAILLMGESLGEFASVFGWDKWPELDRPVQVSRTTIYTVLREGTTILNNDILQCNAFDSIKSLTGSEIQSLLCVPLMVFGKVLGAIYLDTSDPQIHFDEEHLQLLTGIAGISAVALNNVRHMEWLESESQGLEANLNIQHKMVGQSPRMLEVYRCIAKVAPTDSTVLICGESGTGKELVARAIHLNSPRAKRPLVAINCAALTETLLESELFGHEKGSFTGAITQTKGKLEVAINGTVFLDEVGELALTLQAKLLRVLQEREFERVGGTRPIKADIRFIVATNKDLQAAVKAGSFRQDLYYRLNVVSLRMPSLRERHEDIPLLASYFVTKFSQKGKRQVRGISAATRACLCNYDWPGNVRELENTIERAVVLGSSNFILPEDLPDVVLETATAPIISITKYHQAVKETKKQLILGATVQTGGNYTDAARLLGVHPNYLHRLIRNLNLKSMIMK